MGLRAHLKGESGGVTWLAGEFGQVARHGARRRKAIFVYGAISRAEHRVTWSSYILFCVLEGSPPKGRKNEWTRYNGARMKVFKNSGKEIKEYMQETGAKWRAAKDGDVLEVDHTSLA